MCKPILPLIQDELAHIFWKAEHIATVHHHHGDHHAEEEIAEAAHEEEHDKSPTTTKTSEPVSVHIVLHTLNAIPQISTEKQKFKIIVSNFLTISLDKHYPPPKSC
jgi:hypothetical protein